MENGPGEREGADERAEPSAQAQRVFTRANEMRVTQMDQKRPPLRGGDAFWQREALEIIKFQTQDASEAQVTALP